MARIGVAISGGGHRAALFGLGALMYLVDAGKNRDVTSIASVSGGSLTNGFVGQSVDFTTVEPDEFDRRVKPFVHCIAQQGTVIPPSPRMLAYLIVLGLVAVGTFVGVWFLPLPVWARVIVFFAALLVLGYVARFRGDLTAREFATKLFSPTGSPTRLDAVSDSLDHVICASDLHTGENVYFSGRFVASYRFGWGRPGDIPLHIPVQCSAALPGPFPPRWLRKDRHAFQAGRPEAEAATHMVLVDGGVYDNQADQWVMGMANRRTRFGDLAAGIREADELVVVNGSGGLGWGSTAKMRIPLFGELLALLRDNSILYDNGNGVRRQLMIARFTAAERGLGGFRGALVHIPRDPLWVASQYEASPDEDTAGRARAILELLRPNADRWKDLSARAGGQKTSLTKLGTEAAADLLEHGYVLAMANLHVILNYPRLDPPSRARFEALAG
jgi:predicted acylesterase/phospholipase RssA